MASRNSRAFKCKNSPQPTVVRARPTLHDRFIKDRRWNLFTTDAIFLPIKTLSNVLIMYPALTSTGIHVFLFSTVCCAEEILLPQSIKTMTFLYRGTPDCREQISAAGTSWAGAAAAELLGICWSSACVTCPHCYFRWIKRNFNHLCDTYTWGI